MTDQITSDPTLTEVYDSLISFIEYSHITYEKIDERFEKVHESFAKINQTLTYHETWLRQIDEKLNHTATRKQIGSLASILESKTILNRFEVEHIMSH